MNATARLPFAARLLLALFRGTGAEIVQGDIEERYRRRLASASGRWRAHGAFAVDAVRSLTSWWRPSAVARRARTTARAAHHHRRESRMPFNTFAGDLRVTVRSLARRPAFTLVVLVTFGLGIGATTTIYTIVDTVVVRPLPYDDSNRLVAVGNTFPGREWADEGAGLQRLAGVSLKNFIAWRDRSQSMEQMAAAELASALLPDVGDGPELVPLVRVTEGFFSLFRVTPVLGRTFGPADYAGTNGPVVMLSYGSWVRRFGADPTVVGGTVSTTGTPYTVVGVLPDDFTPPEAFGRRPLEFWAPIDATHPRYEARGRRSLYVFARLAPDATVRASRTEIDMIQARLAAEFPDGNVYPNGDRLGAGVNSLHADTVGASQRTLVIFLAASALLLLIATLNAANLLLVRGLDRQGEMAVRRALGAGRGRLARTLVSESVLLAMVGGVVGLAVAFAGVAGFARFAPRSLPRLGEVAVDLRIVAVTAVVSLGVGVVVGMVPALRLTGGGLATTITATVGTTVAATGARLRSTLVAAQLALAVVLAVGASLLFNSFVRVSMVDPGFTAGGLTTFSMPLKRPNAPDGEAVWQAWDALLTQIRGVPGVTAVAAASVLPFHSPQWAPWILLPGEPNDHRREGVAGYVITPNFFDVAQVEVVSGRAFTDGDGPTAANVAIVNEAFVAQHLASPEAVGMTIRFRDSDDASTELRVVGVVANVVQSRAEEGARPAVYVPYTQRDWAIAHVILRGNRDADALAPELRQAAARFSPYVPVQRLASMTSRIRVVHTEPRFQALLIGSFAAVALLLAAIGLYGSLAHAVGRRTRELGIRMALGAARLGIFQLVLRQGLGVAAAGLGVGLAGAMVFSRFLESFLFEVGTLDALSLVVASSVLGLAAVIATVMPARRASHVDVVGSLKAE